MEDEGTSHRNQLNGAGASRHAQPAAKSEAAERYKPGYDLSWAAVIGINNYQHFGSLDCAVNDAAGMADLLTTDLGFDRAQVLVILDPPPETPSSNYHLVASVASRDAIGELLFTTLPNKVGPDDRVLVFFAGHGESRELPSGVDKGYLVPADGRPGEWHTFIEMDNVIEAGDLFAAKHLFYLIDACFSGLAIARSGVQPSRFERDMLTHRARQALTAGNAEQAVADRGPGGHSLFTSFVLQGLGGEAAQEDSQVITASDLIWHVRRQVATHYESHQTPDGGPLPGHQSSGDFVFRLPPDRTRSKVQEEQPARTLRAVKLSLKARVAISRRLEQSLLLAVEAVRVTRDYGAPAVPEAEQVLHDALVAAGTQPFTLPERAGDVTSITISPDNQWLVTIRDHSVIQLWRLPPQGTLDQPIRLAEVDTQIEQAIVGAGSRSLVTIHSDKSVRLWDLAEVGHMAKSVSLAGSGDEIGAMTVSPDHRWLAMATSKQHIRLWDLTAADLKPNPHLLIQHADTTEALALSPSSRWLVAASRDGKAHLWDLKEPYKTPSVFTAPAHFPSRLAVSDDALRLVSVQLNGFLDDSLYYWQRYATSDEPKNFFTKAPNLGQERVLSCDAHWFARSHLDSSVMLWNLTGTDPKVPFMEWEGGAGPLFELAIGAGSRWLAASCGGTVYRWDLALANRREPVVLGPRDPGVKESTINALSISADGSWLGTRSENGICQLWLLELDSLEGSACRSAGRNLSLREWKEYFPGEMYRATCPNIPIGAEEALARADGFARAGDARRASTAYEGAVRAAVEGENARLCNKVCWRGSLHGLAQLVQPACQRAVELEPGFGPIRDSRGLARALLGDLEGAAEDFEYYIGWLRRESEEDTESKEKQNQRRQWIEQLRAGRNPFDAETLEALRSDL